MYYASFQRKCFFSIKKNFKRFRMSKIIPSFQKWGYKKLNFLTEKKVQFFKIIITLQTSYKITRERFKNKPHTERYDRFNCLMIHELWSTTRSTCSTPVTRKSIVRHLFLYCQLYTLTTLVYDNSEKFAFQIC